MFLMKNQTKDSAHHNTNWVKLGDYKEQRSMIEDTVNGKNIKWGLYGCMKSPNAHAPMRILHYLSEEC